MIRRLVAGAGLVGLLGAAILSRSLNGGAHASPSYADLAPASSGIHIAEQFNYNVSNHAADEKGHVNFVWAANAYWALKNSAVPGVKHDWYTLFTGDDNEDTKHDLTWYQANHPDWIEYACDRTTPVHGQTWTQYDVTNPAVLNYALTYVKAAMDGGFDGVEFDVTDTFNFNHACGHYNQNGTWVQQYNGNTVDEAYRVATRTAFARFSQMIRDAAAQKGISFTIGINPVMSAWHMPAQVEDLFPYVDVVLDEAGFTNYGYDPSSDRVLAVKTDYTTNEWLQKMHFYQDLHAGGKVLIINGEVTNHIDASNPPRPDDVNWILANYLLAKDNYTYQALITQFQQYGGPYYDFTPYHANVGSATDSMHQSQGVWMRDYTNGLALVNPSPDTAYTVTLPAGTTYTDVYGHTLGSRVTLAAGGSGLVAVASGSAPVPTGTTAPTSTPQPTSTTKPTATATPKATSTPQPTSTAAPSNTPQPTSTPIVQPTNTPTPRPTNTPTPRPTNTPTPRPTNTPPVPPTSTPTAGSGRSGGSTSTSAQVISNGGFEDGTSGWSTSPLSPAQMIDQSRPHSGSWAADLCAPLCNGTVSQTVNLPATVNRAQLSFWVYSDARPACAGVLATQIQSAAGLIFNTFSRCSPGTGGAWVPVTYDVTGSLAAYAGQSVQIVFRGFSSGAGSGHMYLDDVRLVVN